MPVTGPQLPDLIGGRFRIRSLLGSGATASVYEALDTVEGGVVAVKVLHPHLDVTPTVRAAFFREASIARSISHPSVARVVAMGDDGDLRVWTAWMFAPGVTLAELVRTRGPLPPAAALAVVDRVLGALEAVHAAGYVHRDVSASNVLVQREAGGDVTAVTLIDLGVADRPGRSARAGDVLLSGVTPAAEGIVGNPAYASPEHLRGDAVGVAGDIYQVGALLYLALVGEPPFVRASIDETVRAHLMALPPTVSVRARGVPVELDRFVVRALMKEPGDRFASAPAMRSALSAAALSSPRGVAASMAVAPSGVPAPATRLLPSPVARSAAETVGPRSGASSLMWILLSTAAVLVGILVFALVPRAAPVEAQERPHASSSAAASPSVSSASPSPPAARAAETPGPRSVTVPTVVGRQEEDARALLAAAGLRVAEKTGSSDGTDAVGTVTATDPAPGEVSASGGPITLVVASGFNTVPDVRGATADRAQYSVASAGFAIVLRHATSSIVPAGGVIDVDPAAGSRWPLGTPVTLTLSTGAATPTPLPSPTGTTRAPTSTPTPEPSS
ncbi:hypothetical protein C1632_01795 [Microbacterium testaceum]|nr:hypothetical protein C1632_01795 [Microbacterium testaceum]